MVEKFEPINLEQLGQKPKLAELFEEQKEKKIARGLLAYNREVNNMMLQAVLKHPEAISHRNFLVSSSAIGESDSASGGYQVEVSVNFKPREIRQNSWDKLCAENNVCTALILDGSKYIPGIVVASHHEKIGDNPEDKIHNGKALHCCRNCRNLFRDLIKKGIMSNETMIRFVNDSSLVYEDSTDTQKFKGIRQDPNEVIELPKLKLTKEITEADIIGLPFDEMTMEKFLNLPSYKDDPESEPGYTAPPYNLDFGA